jgi:5,5'-dehydrodivanillate O-demethylase oxygenase subunit
MTTKAENELLTRVGPGTPMGETLRRYWWPVGISADLQAKPTFIRVLGEDLVLFRDGQGRPRVLGALCSHRRANLCLGSTEQDGIRCRYHGWVYDREGKVLETPGEPDATFRDGIQHLAYPAQELGGLVFVYLGPQPAPLLPRFDFLAGEGEQYARITGFANCNWLQCVENGMDPLHVTFTHGDVWTDLAIEPEMQFVETDWGLVHITMRPADEAGAFNYREHHLLLSGISCGGNSGRNLDGAVGTPPSGARWSVPIDDTHTMMVRARFKAKDNPGKFRGEPIVAGWQAVPIESYKEYKESDHPTLGYTMARVIATEDATLMDSLGPIADRENEHLLIVGDNGLRRLREMYLQAVADVQAGRDPKGVIRDPAQNESIPITAYERIISAAERQRMQAASGSAGRRS